MMPSRRNITLTEGNLHASVERKSCPRRLTSRSGLQRSLAKNTHHHGEAAMIDQMKHLRYSNSQKGR
jgi:site-specific recombinase